MVNLISRRQRSIVREVYLLRVITVLGFALASVGLAVAVLLLPSYLLLRAEVGQAEEYVTAAQAIASERAKGQAPETLKRFEESVKLLTQAGRAPATATILERTTQDMPKGLALTAVSIVYAENGEGKLTISGRARTRAELIAYSNQLKKVENLTNVALPVSDLVADVDSEFTVTAVWKP